MKRVNKKKIKKKSSKKKRRRINSKKKSYNKAIDLQKVMAVKFQTLTKVYENFKKKREIEKLKREKLKSKER